MAMTVGTVLALVAWLVVGLTGTPVDPFVPLVAAVALHREWPPALRLVAAVALGPLAALATGDLLVERAGLYAVVGVLATRAEWTLQDGVVARVLLVAASLAVVLGVRSLLSLGGATPAPGETLPALAATLAWTAAHAGATVLLSHSGPRRAEVLP